MGGGMKGAMMGMMQQMMGGGGGGKGQMGPYGGGKGCMGGMGGMKGGGGDFDMNTLLQMSMQHAPGAAYNQRSDAQQVQIRNLPGDCTDYDLYKLLCPFGALAPRGVKAMLTPEGMCTGVGWVDFVEE